jgi:hypothetical protein
MRIPLAQILLSLALLPGVARAGEPGEIFVSSSREGLPITLDGALTGQVTPALLKGVPPGPHTVEIALECEHFQAEVEVLSLQIARLQAEPVGGTGALSVTTAPSGAEVYLDGEPQGPSPVEIWGVSCEEHSLIARAPGYLETARALKVPAFKTTEVQIALKEEAFGVLVVSVEPLTARVAVDDVVVADGPITLDRMDAGPHAVKVLADGYVGQERSVYVEADKVTRLEVVLEPGAGGATLAAAPAEPAPAEPAPAAPAATPAEPAVAAAEPAPAAPAPAPATTASSASSSMASSTASSAASSSGSELPVTRLALNGGVTVVGLGLVGYGASSYLAASEAYNRFLVEESDAAADEIYANEVAPARTTALISGGLGAAALVGGAALWLTTDYTLYATPRGVGASWRW